MQNKNDKIIAKFYQLRVMDFLARKVTLEYEVTCNREKYLEQKEQEERSKTDTWNMKASAFRREVKLYVMSFSGVGYVLIEQLLKLFFHETASNVCGIECAQSGS